MMHLNDISSTAYNTHSNTHIHLSILLLIDDTKSEYPTNFDASLKSGQSPSGRDIFCLKNFDTFTRTPVRVPKINAVASAQLTFQMLTLLQK